MSETFADAGAKAIKLALEDGTRADSEVALELLAVLITLLSQSMDIQKEQLKFQQLALRAGGSGGLPPSAGRVSPR